MTEYFVIIVVVAAIVVVFIDYQFKTMKFRSTQFMGKRNQKRKKVKQKQLNTL